MKMQHSIRHGIRMKRAMHLAVPALLLCAASALQAATNWVDGLAYGRNYQELATALSISSRASTNGSLVVGYGSTTNLTLSHNITGYVIITNQVPNFTVNASGATVEGNLGVVFAAQNATNLVITGGRFIGTEGADGTLPPIPGQPNPTNSTTTAASGGILFNSTVEIQGSEFAGTNATDGLYVDLSVLSVSNGTFRGGSSGTGLIARNHSSVTIHSGSVTGGEGNTAFYLQNSDATVYGGTFSGNIGSTNAVAGDGLFSELTEATTNHVDLYGGTFSSLAFYSTNGAVQNFLAGTNLVVQNGIIQNGGTVMVDNRNNTALRNLTIQSGTMDFGASTYSLVDGGILGFGIEGTTNGLLRAEIAYLHTNATIKVTANGLPSGENDVTLLSTDSGIFMVGVTTNVATGTDFTSNNVEVAISGRSRLKAIFVDNSRDLRFQFTTQSLGEYWGATGQLGELADELEDIGNLTMMGIIDSFDNPDTSKALVEQTYFSTHNTFLVSMQGLQAALGQSVARGAEFREQLKLHPRPKGAQGPPVINNQLRGWAKYYGQFLSHDADGLNAEYEATLHGGAVGYDKSIGSLLLGMSGGAGSYRITSGLDAEETIRAYHGALYGTYGTERAYFDGGIAYGFNRVESRTDVPFILNSEFDAQLLSAYLGAGYDLIDTKGGTVFTPEASIQYSTYKQDAYTETSTTAVPRRIDSFDTDSLRSSLGLNVSMLNTTALETFGFKIDGRFHWLHEFNPEPGNISFSLEGGNNDYQLAAPLLDEETFRLGFGFSFFNTLRQKPKNVLLRLDFDELFGDGFNSHNLSAKVIYAF